MTNIKRENKTSINSQKKYVKLQVKKKKSFYKINGSNYVTGEKNTYNDKPLQNQNLFKKYRKLAAQALPGRACFVIYDITM